MKVIEKYNHIFFDLFHTLTSVDGAKSPEQSTSEILGIGKVSLKQQLLACSSDRLKGVIDDPVKIVERMAMNIDPNIPKETITKAADIRIECFKDLLINIDKETLSVIESLKLMGRILGIVSNADVCEIYGWNKSPLKQYFDSVTFSCHVGYMKPEKEIYEIALKKHNVTADQCLFIGDGGNNELKGASNLGFTTILATHVIKHLFPDEIEGLRVYANYEVDEICKILTI